MESSSSASCSARKKYLSMSYYLLFSPTSSISFLYRFDTTGSGKMVIQVDGREVALTCIHVGVDLLRVNEILNNKVRKC